ncbi:histidine kinase [Aquimarina gracilis]|uniref:Histidine kinase n=1 Tax=Aquimarina gracilis TaxID=874422 RepID=A0ABU6A1T9_9FLAO|nr:histidine kinase [Aquimarina gracilis]MEB3348061.1 histidine kinase [Aquimarina gracilis]
MNWLGTHKGWTLERISRHVLYWMTWSTLYVLINYFTVYNRTLWRCISHELVVLPIKMGCAYVIAYVLMPKFLYKKQYLKFIITTILTAGIFGWMLLMLYYEMIYPTILGKTGYYTDHASSIYKSIELIYITSFVLGIKFFQNILQERKRNQDLLQQKIEAELKYLKNQVQPHFLFNTLNNIYGMVLSNDKKAGESIVKLSEILGYLLYESDVELISLISEIDNLENFIELERLRYDRKLDFKYQKLGLPCGAYISPLILLPFVENAFKHGPAKEEGKSTIDLRIEVSNSTLNFSIKNTYNEFSIDSSVKSGIGMKNITKRLALIYPERHKLIVKKGEMFEVDLEIRLS